MLILATSGQIAGIVVLAVVAAFLLIVLASSVKVVRQTDMYIIERLGGYFKTWTVGLHMLLPFFDRITKIVPMKEQIHDFPPQPVITRDNVTMQIDTIVFYQVTDPKLYAYGVENPIFGIEALTATTLRNIIGDLDLDATLTSRDIINAKMRAILDEATDPWGIKVTRVEVKNILPPKDIRDAMERQMRAEREKREKILLAEGQKASAILISQGNKQSAILEAEGQKEATIRDAEAKAQSILNIKKAEAEGEIMVRKAEAQGIEFINNAKPSAELIKLKSYEALIKVADGQATKIIIPSDLQGIASLATSITEIVTTKSPKLKEEK
jgi:regulator of protease activity HflC (stomatin/prohibitin superfamily)